jgi:parallel beta-helix repeat protein
MAYRGGFLLACLAAVSILAAEAAIIPVSPGESIQRALSEAAPGDVIVVEGGIYHESLNITEQITLQGRDHPSIEALAGKSGITILADRAKVSGFDVRSPRKTGIEVLSDGNLLEDCNISGCADGIRLQGQGNTITNSSISNNTNGICLVRSDGNFIGYNYISYNTGDGSDCGIYLVSSKGNNISHNNLMKNGDCAISLRASSGNMIQDNNASGNDWYGISLEEASNDNLVARNYIGGNGHAGIYLDSSRKNILRGNEAFENERGIFLSYDSNDNLLEGNTVSENDKGIHLAYHSSNNTLKHNSAIDNWYGIYITLSSGWNSIFGNRLIDNIHNAYDMGIYNHWDNGSVGNYYSDLGSVVYIPGGGGVDRHPLSRDQKLHIAPIF